jgi:hypothetical protein
MPALWPVGHIAAGITKKDNDQKPAVPVPSPFMQPLDCLTGRNNILLNILCVFGKDF